MKGSISKPPETNKKADFNQEDWASAYFNVTQELSDVQLEISKGTIPNNLQGRLFRNGPGRLERGGKWVHHPFDGDGMITAIRFNQGKAFLSNRFVRTQEWEEEEKENRFI